MSDRTEIQDDDAREGSRQLSLQGNDPPSEIEGYSVIRRLGTGAYGTVWLAREDRTGRMVAIKYYPHRRGLNWSLLNREVEKLATLYSSRNIVRLLDVGWNAEPPYYVMEYVENGSLGAYLASGPPSVEESVRISQQICGALIEAHGAGVLHCDLKPDNVLLDAQFQVRLCDFGQSRMSHEQSPALGTLYYMAPEQADLDAIPDARWDVYAVGAIMYHLLTGQPPYRDAAIQRRLESTDSLPDRLQVYQRHIRDSPPPNLHQSVKGVDKQLANVIDQCLVADPRERLPNAQAILTKLANRERNRSRRPLLLLGVLGPILLMCAVFPIFFGAIKETVREAESRQINSAQAANTLIARSQANALKEELEHRLQELEQIVSREEVVRVLTELMQRPSDEVVAEIEEFHSASFDKRPLWLQELDTWHQRAQDHNSNQGKSLDASWFLQDASGRQLWRRDYSNTVGKNWAWRDYFHGGTKYTAMTAPPDLKPIRQPHVSLPFVSKATDQYMVALSVPVRTRSNEVIGVFARTLHLGALQRALGQDIQGKDSGSRVITLADRRGKSQLLDHRLLTPEMFADQEAAETEAMFQQLHLCEATLKKIESRMPATEVNANTGEALDIREDQYVDPVGKLKGNPSANDFDRDWIAAISLMKSDKMPWLVIVQQDRLGALEPMQSMEREAFRQLVYAALVSIAILAGIWLFVWQALRRSKERAGHRSSAGAVSGSGLSE